MTRAKGLSKSAEKEAKRKQGIREAFDQFFTGFYGQERWASLARALEGDVRYGCLLNRRFVDTVLAIETSALSDADIRPYLRRWPFAPGLECLVLSSDGEAKRGKRPFPPPERAKCRVRPGQSKSIDRHMGRVGQGSLMNYYILDPASLLTVEALDVQPHHRVLDLCAAPGGKSLAILQCLNDQGHLYCNEPCKHRRTRLRKVMEDYVDPQVIERHLTITSFDIGGKKGAIELAEEMYDRVLVDAPCSSERHLLEKVDALADAQWTPTRTKAMAKKQVQILRQALRCLAPGGRLVYSTCSISPYENDAVVQKAMDKADMDVHIVRDNDSAFTKVGEKTTLGCILLPDQRERLGPIYYAILERASLNVEMK